MNPDHTGWAFTTRPDGSTGVFDRVAALESLDGDEEFLGELIGIFEVEGPRWMDSLIEAAEAGDAANLGRLGHTIRGAAGALHLGEVEMRAARVEAEAQSAESAMTHAAVTELVAAMSRTLVVFAKDPVRVVN